MKSILYSLLILSLTLAPGVFVFAEEPAEAPPGRNAKAGDAPAPASGYSGTDTNYFLTLFDVSNSLVAANGLGIDVAAPDAALQAQLGLVPGQGMLVTSVPEESMAAKAGLKAHDIITQVNEVQIS